MMNDFEELIILRCKNNRYEVYHDKYRLCWFGTNDLRIQNDCNNNFQSFSELGDAYE